MNRATKTNLVIAMAGGGSGGHVFPIKSLLEYAYQNQDIYNKIKHIYWYGSSNSMEQEQYTLLSKEIKHKCSFVKILSGKLRREKNIKAIGKNIIDIAKFKIGIIQALIHIKKHKIDVIFCKGGYVALPVVIAGKLLGKKIIVHESDIHAGLVNRIASKFAQKVFCGFDDVIDKAQTVGQILSDDIVVGERPFDHKLLSDHTKILVVGGSLGSKSLYEGLSNILKNHNKILKQLDFFVVGGYLNKRLSKLFQDFDNVYVYNFVSQKQMGDLCRHCDIAITRAGTTSLAEEKLYDMKLFIIPIPWTHDQKDNALFYQKHFDDIIIQQDKYMETKLFAQIKTHLGYKKTLSSKDRLKIVHQTKQIIRKSILSHTSTGTRK